MGSVVNNGHETPHAAYASEYAQSLGGKAWRYVLIPHDVIVVNMTLEVMVGRFGG